MVYSAIVIFHGDLTHIFQGLQALKKVRHCVFLLHGHSVASLDCVNISSKTTVNFFKSETWCYAKATESPFGDQHIYHSW